MTRMQAHPRRRNFSCLAALLADLAIWAFLIFVAIYLLWLIAGLPR